MRTGRKFFALIFGTAVLLFLTIFGLFKIANFTDSVLLQIMDRVIVLIGIFVGGNVSGGLIRSVWYRPEIKDEEKGEIRI